MRLRSVFPRALSVAAVSAIASLPLLALAPSASATTSTFVISQVYGGGGNPSAPWNADFIELHNVSSSNQSLEGLTVQYGNALSSGLFSGVVDLPNMNVPADGYVLIQMGPVGPGGSALPDPDVIASPPVVMGADRGKVALVDGTIRCPSTDPSTCQPGRIVDFVGYGPANTFEGAASAPSPSDTQSIMRKGADTDNNGADFVTTSNIVPKNLTSAGIPVVAGNAALVYGTGLAGATLIGLAGFKLVDRRRRHVVSGQPLRSAV